MEQSELIKRIKTIQNCVFWVLMWLAFYFILTNKKSGATAVLVFLFLFALSYFMSSFYFIRLSGYVSNDIALRLSSLYQEHQIPIKKFMKVVGIILLILLVVLFLVYLPNNEIGNRTYQMITAIIASIFGAIIVFYLNKKQTKE